MLPWRHAAISGWILDPDRKKMSKSKGNAVTPMDLLREHGTDAVRYWATSARLGVDTAFDLGPDQDRAAARHQDPERRPVRARLRAARRVGSGRRAAERSPSRSTGAMVRRLAEFGRALHGGASSTTTTRLALEQAERFFWFFCDDYLELVKARAYGEHGTGGRASAVATLRLGLSVLLRLLAPFLPFVTEEVWSWWQDGSVHRAAWPDAADLRAQAGPADDAVLEAAVAAIAAIRKAKSQARLPMKDPVAVADRDGRAGPPGRAAGSQPGRAGGRPCRRDRAAVGARG